MENYRREVSGELLKMVWHSGLGHGHFVAQQHCVFLSKHSAWELGPPSGTWLVQVEARLQFGPVS